MIRFDRLTYEEAVAACAPMLGEPKWDTSGGLYGVDDLIGGGVAYVAADDAGPLVLLVVQQVQRKNGRELIVRLARQIAGSGDLTERVLPEIERAFGAGCQAVTIHTKRRGLVRKLEAAGYEEAAVTMRKAIQ
jgi:hypothetical protein